MSARSIGYYGEQAGIRHVTLHVKGEYEFGYGKQKRASIGVLDSRLMTRANGRRGSAAVTVVRNLITREIEAEIPRWSLDIVAFVTCQRAGAGEMSIRWLRPVSITPKPKRKPPGLLRERSQRRTGGWRSDSCNQDRSP